MNESLVGRWMNVLGMDSVLGDKRKFVEMYVRGLGPIGEENRERIEKLIFSLDEERIRGIVLVLAEEHFSEDALRAAVEFFESEAGARYQVEKQTVMAAATAAIQKLVGEATRKAFGL